MHDCCTGKMETVDLKQYYDTCQEEKLVGDYTADLLLTSSSNPNREPVSIEIWVTHKCTPSKIESGKKIIEIRIKEEKDIGKLLNDTIEENPYTPIVYERNNRSNIFVDFYGFKRDSNPEPLSRRRVLRFYLFRSGRAFVTNMDDIRFCRQAWIKENESAIFEVSMDCSFFEGPTPYQLGYAAARRNGFDIKTCLFCKYYRNGFSVGYGDNPTFCCLYKKFGTPKHPEQQYAQDCSFYREDIVLLEGINKNMPPMVVAK